MTLHAKGGWLHYTTCEGKHRAIKVDTIAAVLQERWAAPTGQQHEFTHLRARSGSVYRVPHEYADVMPRVLLGKEDEA